MAGGGIRSYGHATGKNGKAMVSGGIVFVAGGEIKTDG